jgi:hypothetical protein
METFNIDELEDMTEELTLEVMEICEVNKELAQKILSAEANFDLAHGYATTDINEVDNLSNEEIDIEELIKYILKCVDVDESKLRKLYEDGTNLA